MTVLKRGDQRLIQNISILSAVPKSVVDDPENYEVKQFVWKDLINIQPVENLE